MPDGYGNPQILVVYTSTCNVWCLMSLNSILPMPSVSNGSWFMSRPHSWHEHPLSHVGKTKAFAPSPKSPNFMVQTWVVYSKFNPINYSRSFSLRFHVHPHVDFQSLVWYRGPWCRNWSGSRKSSPLFSARPCSWAATEMPPWSGRDLVGKLWSGWQSQHFWPSDNQPHGSGKSAINGECS